MSLEDQSSPLLPEDSPAAQAPAIPAEALPVSPEAFLPEAAPQPLEPPWSLSRSLLIFFLLAVSILVCQLAAMMIASCFPSLSKLPEKELAANPFVVLGGMVPAYFWTLWMLRRMVCSASGRGFAAAIHWSWPRLWPLYALAGAAMSLAMQWLGNVLPHPSELPVDSYFNSPAASWSMALFGTLLAPLAEELLFRGMLYPVLRRKCGILCAVALTTAGFALIHFDQLGGAWGPILVIVLVGLILTLVRELANSVAASFVMHLFYNGTVFVMVGIATHGFRETIR